MKKLGHIFSRQHVHTHRDKEDLLKACTGRTSLPKGYSPRGWACHTWSLCSCPTTLWSAHPSLGSQYCIQLATSRCTGRQSWGPDVSRNPQTKPSYQPCTSRVWHSAILATFLQHFWVLGVLLQVPAGGGLQGPPWGKGGAALAGHNQCQPVPTVGYSQVPRAAGAASVECV